MDIFFDTSVGSAVSHLHLRKSFSYKAILHMLWSKYEYISQYLLICHFPLNSNQHKHSQDESILINFSKSRLVFCESVYIFLFDSILLFWVLRSFIFIQNYIILFPFRGFDYCILYILGFFFYMYPAII